MVEDIVWLETILAAPWTSPVIWSTVIGSITLDVGARMYSAYGTVVAGTNDKILDISDRKMRLRMLENVFYGQ